MFVEKIKDKFLKKRIAGYVKNFPRTLKEDNPTKNPNTAKMMAELLKGDDMICLPKDKVIPIGAAIEKEPDIILPSKVVDHFIETASHRVLMNFCICHESMECEDYPIELGCMFLGDAAKKIHPELGREASVEESKEHARKCRDSGLVYSVGKSKLDSVWLAVGPDTKLLTICNCCPCCCLTRTVPYSAPILGESFSRMPGVQVYRN
jgi:hypothetical protein